MNIHAKLTLNATETAFARTYDERRAGLPGVADGTLSDLRDAAIGRFQALGLPHRRIEEWHYTDLRRLLGENAIAQNTSSFDANALGVAETAFSAMKPARMVFAGGRFVPECSDLTGLGDGVDIQPLSAGPLPDWAVAEISTRRPQGDNAVFDLSTALMSDGALIRVRAGVTPDRAIEIIDISSKGGAVLRHVICLEEGASLRLIEQAVGVAALSVDAMTVTLGPRARLDHVKVQDMGPVGTHIAPVVVEVGAEARINTFTLTTGAALAREERHVRFAGDDAGGSISGAFLLAGKTHADMTLVVDHAKPGGQSHEVFRGIVDDQAKSVVQTNVIVAQYAQKTDARQAIHVLLLSDEAEHNTKPELEIYADDVQCAHGATIGELDETSLFYLMARGIPRAIAESMLIEAFVSGAMAEIADEEFREVIGGLATGCLKARRDARHLAGGRIHD